MTKLKKNLPYLDPDKTPANSGKELEEGLRILNSYEEPLVSIFGSHFPPETNGWYSLCLESARQLGKEGFGVITGGGPGIMEAGNRGAKEAGAPSIGFCAGLLKDEKQHPGNFTGYMNLEYVFIRRFLLSIKSEALIFFPGGYGTLNELFEFVTLIQVGIMDHVPIICVGSEYWKGLFKWVRETVVPDGYVTMAHVDMIQFADSADEIVQLVKG